MNLSELEKIATTCIDSPWGCGDPFLENSESQPPYYRFLNKVVRHYKPAFVVECGVYLATATVHMCIANAGTMVIGIDPAPHGKAYSATLLYPNMNLLLGYSTEKHIFELVKKQCGDKGIGLLFLDSIHDGDTPRQELELYTPIFAEECLVCADDVLDHRMYDFWLGMPGEKMTMNFLHPAQYPGMPDAGFGVSIIRK